MAWTLAPARTPLWASGVAMAMELAQLWPGRLGMLAGSQREPRLLVTPEGAEGSPHPDIEAALGGHGAGQLADHEGRGQTPHEWNDGEDQQRAEVPRAAERVLDAIGATGDHKEGRGDKREKAQPSAFVQRVRWIWVGHLSNILEKSKSCA